GVPGGGPPVGARLRPLPPGLRVSPPGAAGRGEVVPGRTVGLPPAGERRPQRGGGPRRRGGAGPARLRGGPRGAAQRRPAAARGWHRRSLLRRPSVRPAPQPGARPRRGRVAAGGQGAARRVEPGGGLAEDGPVVALVAAQPGPAAVGAWRGPERRGEE